MPMTASPPPTDPRWTALAARDESQDGAFVYAVRSTGIFCRPTCPSRRPRPENVAFYADAVEAEAAGFRACLRCRPAGASPLDEQAGRIAAACRAIEDAETLPALEELASAAGLSPFHFHRRFKAATGLTPHAYGAAVRARRMQRELDQPQSVTRAAYEAGFGSASRFYAEAGPALGMTPGERRAGGARARIRTAFGASWLGTVLVAATERGVCAILLGDEPEALMQDLRRRFRNAVFADGDADFQAWVAAVVALLDRPTAGLDLPLDVQGTAFQHRVWQALRAIPAGRTSSYTEIAREIGAPGAVRAVAGACAANPLAVAIPCHRVVRQDGDLSGYRWGIARKRALLEREGGGAPGPTEPRAGSAQS